MNALELKIPPVAVVLVVAVLMGLITRLLPEFHLDLPRDTVRLIAVVIATGGVLFAAAGVWSFRKAQTTVNPTRPDASSSVVTTGVYRVSRNPMYVGILLVLTAWALFLSNALALVGLPLFILYMNRFQIGPEERTLSAKFGEAYQTYRERVRRWL